MAQVKLPDDIMIPQWTEKEREACRKAGGGWNGIEAVIKFIERSFYGNK